MFDPGRAVLHSLAETGLNLPSPILVINDFNRDMVSAFENVKFWNPEEEPAEPEGEFKTILLFSPKQKEESRFLTALGLEKLSRGGLLILAAANEAGGKTLYKMLVEFGVPSADHSKHKCRVVWTDKPDMAAKVMIENARRRGDIQQREDGLWSQPGLFSWDRLDKGTNALLHHLPLSVSGLGADFGCGIGVIGLRLLQRYKEIEKLICLDRDARALECCSRNLQQWPEKFETRRADLTQGIDLPKLDFIIMNPPFHIGKKQSVAIGQGFISNAAKSLKQGGTFIFVANVHLPYEQTVAENFSFMRVLSEEHGFKIIEAVK